MLRNVRIHDQTRYTRALLRVLAAGGAMLNGLGPRPFAAVAKLVARLSGRRRICEAEIADNLWFQFDVGDFYWNRIVYRGFDCEPELRALLNMLRDLDYVFFDCGANFGYWSLLASHHSFGGHRVIAVEASPATCSGLRLNVSRTQGQIEVHEKAISNSSGRLMQLFERGSHAGASLRNQWLGNNRPISGTYDVETISIDDLVASVTPPARAPFVIKLDVEGAEIDAIQGAMTTLRQDALIIYEEYGEDRECRVTAHVLSATDMHIFFMSDDGRLQTIHTIEQVRNLKRHRRRGYNMIATRPSTSFHEALTRAIWME